MSTQHPDNVTIPFFSDSEVMAGETEIKEAFYAFSHLGCTEQMWDCEGKEVDGFVVEKLLSRYPEFFRTLPLGRDYRLTLRLPNPAVERNQGKILLEALESIPRHYDIAKAAGIDVPPIFEIILPMTTSAAQVRQILAYYRKFVAGKGSSTLLPGGPTISEWVGELAPSSINVIPLVEDQESLLSAASIATEIITHEKPEYLRVFLARSDPALNYGSAAAVLLNKVSLQRLQAASDAASTPIYPIIGVGSAPFRGNLRPDNVSNCLTEYPSVQTFSVQSSFK
ncbi:MAG: phosphoenolpyruvate carboxylase, partial [Candidatus Micrarchaeota archaeon]|nr:phosphoenolpyruvate carboxylase [Candidatus Micrarchaeota archaeon]